MLHLKAIRYDLILIKNIGENLIVFLSIYMLSTFLVHAKENIGMSTPLKLSLYTKNNIATINPSRQTSEQIITLLRNTPSFNSSTIDAKIKMATGIGYVHMGLDENNQFVFMTATEEKYYGKHNLFFCREATGVCRKEVDNSSEQHAHSVGVFAAGKIFVNTQDRNVDAQGGIFGSTLNYYDIASDTYVKRALSIIGLNGETRTMTLGTDGFLYIGGTNFSSTPHYASSARINPQDLSDYTFYTDYYTDMAVDRARSIAADDTHTYQVVGDNPFVLIAFNRSTLSSQVLHQSKNGKVVQLRDGASYQFTNSDNEKEYYWLYNGQKYQVASFDTNPPWYDEMIHGSNYWAYRSYYEIAPGISKPSIGTANMASIFPEPGSELGSANFPYRYDNVTRFFYFSPDVYPHKTKAITQLGSGKIMIGGTAYTGDSLLDPTDDHVTYLGATHISQSVIFEFLDASIGKKRVLIEGYPSASALLYTPDNFFSSENLDGKLGYMRNFPDLNGAVNAQGEHEIVDIHRAFQAVQVDETVYLVGNMYRNGVSGGLLWWNTATDERAALRRGIFDNYQTRSIAQLGNKLAIATQAVDNREYGGTARPTTPKVFLFDTKRKKIIKSYTPLDGLTSVDAGRIATLDGRHIIGISNNMTLSGANRSTKTYLYMIDTVTDKIVMKKTINVKNGMLIQPEGTAQIDGFDFKVHGQYIYTYLDSRTLVRIDKTGKVEPLAILEHQGRMAFNGNTLYVTGSEELIKVALEPEL